MVASGVNAGRSLTSDRLDEGQRKRIRSVEPLLHESEAAVLEQMHDVFRPVLVRALGPNRLVALHAELELGPLDADALRGSRHQMHLDPRVRWVPHRAVREPIDVEIAAELAIDAHEKVAIERR